MRDGNRPPRTERWVLVSLFSAAGDRWFQYIALPLPPGVQVTPGTILSLGVEMPLLCSGKVEDRDGRAGEPIPEPGNRRSPFGDFVADRPPRQRTHHVAREVVEGWSRARWS